MCEKIPETYVNKRGFLYSIFIKYKNITILLFIMGMLFSKIEKFFDKKYRYNYKYDSEYDSIIKNEENNQYDKELEDIAYAEDDLLIYDPKTKIDYYNKKLEGIMYL